MGVSSEARPSVTAKALTVDGKLYSSAFGVYKERASRTQVMNGLLRIIGDAFAPGTEVTVLSVGAGDGQFESDLLAKAGLRVTRYQAFEPNEDHHRELVERFSNLGIPNVDMRCEAFDYQTSVEDKFDIVMFNHSLYYMRAVEVFGNSVRWLEDGGISVAVLQRTECPLPIIALETRKDITFEGGVEPHYFSLSAEELTEGVRRSGVSVQMHELPDEEIDYTTLLEDWSEAAKVWGTDPLLPMLSFMAQVDIRVVPPEVKKNWVDAAIRLSKQSADGNGRRFIPNLDSVMVLQKPSAVVGLEEEWFVQNPTVAMDVPDEEACRLSSADKKYAKYDYSTDLRSVHMEDFIKKMREMCAGRNQVLLCGSNRGVEIPCLDAHKSAAITAMDASKGAISLLQVDYPSVTAQVGSMDNMPWCCDETFDLYVCLRAIQSSTVKLDKAVAEAIRVTAPGGRIVLSIPNGYLTRKNQEIKGMFDYNTGRVETALPYTKVGQIMSLSPALTWTCTHLPSEILMVADKPEMGKPEEA